MAETFLEELKRYVLFDADDEAALRALVPTVVAGCRAIAEDFYRRLSDHEEARRVLTGPEQVERLKASLCEWLISLCAGPWDEAYFQSRERIGRVHVAIDLPQRYMVTAMSFVRQELAVLVQRDPRAGQALTKILDVELAIMLESYRAADQERLRRACRDERAVLELELALSKARYEEIVERGQALVVTADPGGRIVLFNGRCEALTGVDRGRAAGRTWREVFGDGGDDARELEEARAGVLAGRAVAPVTAPVASAGGLTRWIRWQLTTIPGTDGPLLCAIGIDTTEERALAIRSQRAERLASLGTMAAGLAHEIRNPLNAANLQLTLAQRRLAGAPADERLAAARESTALAAAELRRLAAMVTEFLSFARPQPWRLARVCLRALADAAVALLGPEAAAGGVELVLAPGEPVELDADADRLRQVLLNLMRNAVEAAGPGGHARVTIAGAGPRVLLEVADDGPGLPTGAPIFEPFYTTKERGTGLGLAIVHRIVSDHGGQVAAERRAGWTVFRVSLPA